VIQYRCSQHSQSSNASRLLNVSPCFNLSWSRRCRSQLLPANMVSRLARSSIGLPSIVVTVWRDWLGGIPSTFYTDHGSDFTSQHLEQVAADVKMVLIFSLPTAPRGRSKIERFFSTVNQMFLAELPGYGHNSPEALGDILLLSLQALHLALTKYTDYITLRPKRIIGTAM